MIQLRNNPIEGSSVKLGLSFRDTLGKYYIPESVSYTFLALNNDKESWSVVDDIYCTPLEPASVISLTIPNLRVIEGTTLERKVVINYQAFVDYEYTNFVDEINFTLQPQPTISNEPPGPIVPQVYVRVRDISLQIGSLVSAPVAPVFIAAMNMPVFANEGHYSVIDTFGQTVECEITVDSTNTLITITPIVELQYQSHYTLRIEDLTSINGNYAMKQPFEVGFNTIRQSMILQPNKEVTFTHNGVEEVTADEGYSGMAKVTVTVDTQVMETKEVLITTDGLTVVEPDTGYTAMKKVLVTTNTELNVALYAYKDVETETIYYFDKIVTQSDSYKVMDATPGTTFNGFVTTEVTKSYDTIFFTWNNTNVTALREQDSDLRR